MDSDDEDHELDEIVLLTVRNNLLIIQALQMMAMELMESSDEEEEEGEVRGARRIIYCHRHLPRPERNVYDHGAALALIMRDFLSVPPLISDFSSFFRISRPRFQRMLEDFQNSGNRFYQPKYGASVEARLLLPLKCLAFGVSPKVFCSYFSINESTASMCCDKFDAEFRQLYFKEYLRRPTAANLKAISNLHLAVHGVPGMLGSLDCCHTHWRMCPKEWHGSFKGRNKVPTIVLEASSDYHTWFWHTAFGYAGSLSNLNILQLSPLVSGFLDNSFAVIEAASGVIPFEISGQEFNEMYLLADGIYPQYSRFVKGMLAPVTRGEKRLTKWQAKARKDIERAFGILKIRFKFFDSKILLMTPKKISARVATCLMLHNMCVQDRVMNGNVRATYVPSNSFDEDEDYFAAFEGILEDKEMEMDISDEDAVDNNSDMEEADQGPVPDQADHQQLEAAFIQRWEKLVSWEEHRKLHQALHDHFNR